MGWAECEGGPWSRQGFCVGGNLGILLTSSEVYATLASPHLTDQILREYHYTDTKLHRNLDLTCCTALGESALILQIKIKAAAKMPSQAIFRQPPTTRNSKLKALSIIAESAKAARTSSRQRISSLLRNRARQTRRKRRTPSHGGYLASIRNHGSRLSRQVLHLQRTLAAREGVIVIGQVHDRDLARVVAAEEGGPLVQAFT